MGHTLTAGGSGQGPGRHGKCTILFSWPAHPYTLATDSSMSSAAALRLPASRMTTPSTSAERGRATLVPPAAVAVAAMGGFAARPSRHFRLLEAPSTCAERGGNTHGTAARTQPGVQIVVASAGQALAP